MPMWRCPHCATPQTETARCWVCHRSSTACGSCRSFRRSVAAQVGYCGLDPRRQPLRGDEIRACWESREAAGTVSSPLAGAATAWPLEPGADRTAVRLLDFVEVRAEANRDGRQDPAALNSADEFADASDGLMASSAEPGWSFWGEADQR